MRKVADIFALWPSDADLGRDIGVPYPTVSAWKQRGSIPPAYWRAIIYAARRRGHRKFTADLLLDAHGPAAGGQTMGGFEEEEATPIMPDDERPENRKAISKSGDGHFSRHKHIRRNTFKTAEDIEDHLRALRDEWSHR